MFARHQPELTSKFPNNHILGAALDPGPGAQAWGVRGAGLKTHAQPIPEASCLEDSPPGESRLERIPLVQVYTIHTVY